MVVSPVRKPTTLSAVSSFSVIGSFTIRSLQAFASSTRPCARSNSPALTASANRRSLPALIARTPQTATWTLSTPIQIVPCWVSRSTRLQTAQPSHPMNFAKQFDACPIFFRSFTAATLAKLELYDFLARIDGKELG